MLGVARGPGAPSHQSLGASVTRCISEVGGVSVAWRISTSARHWSRQGSPMVKISR